MRSKLWRILPLLAIPVALAFCGCGAREKQGLAHRNPAFRTDARESPTLARLVAEGKLPPLKERLPENPVVIKPFGPAAMYGGTLRMPISGYWDFGGIDTVHSCRLIRKEPVRDKDGKVIICADGRAKYELAGNLVESWKYSADGREVTMKLRKGIRYSDGYPLKVDDLVYRWQIWNDTKLYNEISPVPAQRLQDQPIDLVKIDDYTFKFILPVVDFRWVEAAAIHLQFWEAPKHWLGQWDPNLNPEVKSWEEFKRRFGDWFDLSRPVLGPWRIVQWDSTTRLLAERNPYFYMTDEDGRQLPYIDRVDGIAVQNPDVAVMKVASGQVDLFDNGRLEDLPLLKINERRGDYKLQLLGEGPGSFPGFMINYWTLRDRLAEYFNKKEFRIALSIGINRAEINQLVFSGFGRPTNNSFGDWYRKIHAEYDPDRARAILDKLGLKDTTGNGLRNYPDGKDFTIVITTMLGPYASVAELVASHWRDLGINTIVNNVDGGQYSLMRRERNFDLLTAHDGGYTYREDFDVRSWSPFSERIDLDRPMRTGLWEPYLRWYKSGGTQGQRPPPDMLESLSEVARIYEQEYMTEKDAAKAKEAARKIARLWADNVWRLAAVGSSPMPLVLSNRLWNLPSFIDAPPHGYWLRAGVYAYQLAIGE